MLNTTDKFSKKCWFRLQPKVGCPHYPMERLWLHGMGYISSHLDTGSSLDGEGHSVPPPRVAQWYLHRSRGTHINKSFHSNCYPQSMNMLSLPLPKSSPNLRVFFCYYLSRLQGRLDENRELVLYSSQPCLHTLFFTPYDCHWTYNTAFLQIL